MNWYSLLNAKRFANKKLSGALLGAAFVATTAIVAPSFAHAESQTINVAANEYYRMTAKGAVTRVAIGNPEIADVMMIPNTNKEFLIVGKKAGTTTLLVWRGKLMDEYRITVGFDDQGQARAIENAIGLPKVKARVIYQENKPRILLEGKVKDQIEHDRALKIASLYTGGKMTEPKQRGSNDSGFEYDVAYTANRTYDNVVDLLEIETPTQIRLEAQLIEVSSTDGDQFGFTYGSPSEVEVDTDSGFRKITLGNENTFYAGESFGGNHDTGFWLIDHFTQVNAKIQALLQKGKAKILSRPNISAMSGSKAKIHIGGSMAFPKSDKNDNVTLEWKDYGIRLNISPVVGNNNEVTAEVHAEVSAPDYSRVTVTSAGTYPSMRSRNVHSLVHIGAGSTMVIGGLFSTEDAKTIKKVPLLSSIPILGEFFKHTSSDSEKRELIIMITPRIVTPDSTTQMTDKMKEWYAEGAYEANNRNLVDVNNPPLPEKVLKKQKEDAEKANKPVTEEVREIGGNN